MEAHLTQSEKVILLKAEEEAAKEEAAKEEDLFRRTKEKLRESIDGWVEEKRNQFRSVFPVEFSESAAICFLDYLGLLHHLPCGRIVRDKPGSRGPY